MKALGIIGSPRKDGNSAYLLKNIMDMLEADSFEIETLFLRELDIRPCDGCGYCSEKGECRIKDDMKGIYTSLMECDVIILSSPVYMGGITSRLKAFMERTWFLRRGPLDDKIGSSIIVGRREIGSSVNEMDEYLDRLEVIKIPGIVGYGMKEGDIKKDQEALKGTLRVASKISQLLQIKTEKRPQDHNKGNR